MKTVPFRKISSLFLQKPSKLLREINSNALMVEWSRDNSTDIVLSTRYELYEYVNLSILKNEKIDYLEFGVFEGETIFKWAGLNKDSGSRFYGFDSFEGLPEVWDGVLESKKTKHFDVGGNVPMSDDERIRFVKGWFQDTLKEFLRGFTPEGRLIIHNDSDLYSSTLYCLTMLDDILIKGSIIIFDEFYSSSHEFQAFADYTSAYQRKYSVLGSVDKDPYKQVAIMMD